MLSYRLRRMIPARREAYDSSRGTRRESLVRDSSSESNSQLSETLCCHSGRYAERRRPAAVKEL